MPLFILNEWKNDAIGLIKKEISKAKIKGEKYRNAIFTAAIIIIKKAIFFKILIKSAVFFII